LGWASDEGASAYFERHDLPYQSAHEWRQRVLMKVLREMMRRVV
jgi:hypothetical protein